MDKRWYFFNAEEKYLYRLSVLVDWCKLPYAPVDHAEPDSIQIIEVDMSHIPPLFHDISLGLAIHKKLLEGPGNNWFAPNEHVTIEMEAIK